MRLTIYKRVVLHVWLAFAAMAQIPAVDWKKHESEILERHRALIRIDTSSPPGNETAAVEYLKKTVDRAVRMESITAGARPATPPSPLDTHRVRALERATTRMYPGAATLPAILEAAAGK